MSVVVWPPLLNIVLSVILNVLHEEQEEEMIGWEGAEGGCSLPQHNQSDNELGRDFLCDGGKGEELPGPKFKSLRHLRQVNKKSNYSENVQFIVS